MRIITFSLFSLILSAFLISNQPSPTSAVCNEMHWKTNIALEDYPGPDNQYFLSEISFIKAGQAQLTQKFTSVYRFWAALTLEFPCDKKINGDDCRLEWYAKSDKGIDYRESDMGGTLIGSADTAQINLLSVNQPPYFVFRYGKTNIHDAPELVHNPGSWAMYSIELKNGVMTYYKNGIQIKSISTASRIGQLRAIGMHFKGGGKIEWVKLYEHGKLLMQEDFNSTGKTSLIWKK